MVNFNGHLVSSNNSKLTTENRGYKYGDALFETLKVVNGKLFFWEDHYFRLMASMRIMRMDIPMNFTMEFLESEIFNRVSFNLNPVVEFFFKSKMKIALTKKPILSS